jgi:Fe-S cluster assembly iron-binding protein IscA
LLVVSELAASLIRELTDQGSTTEEAGLRIVVGPTATIRAASMTRGPLDGDVVYEAPGGVLVFVEGASVAAVDGHELDAQVDTAGDTRFFLRPRRSRAFARFEPAG